jgi:hypothetical protein
MLMVLVDITRFILVQVNSGTPRNQQVKVYRLLGTVTLSTSTLVPWTTPYDIPSLLLLEQSLILLDNEVFKTVLMILDNFFLKL